jgi:hypothetical protein
VQDNTLYYVLAETDDCGHLVHLPRLELPHCQLSEDASCSCAYGLLSICVVGVVLLHQVSHSHFLPNISRWSDLTQLSIFCLFTTLVITWRVRSEFISVGMMVFFSIFYPFYLVVMGMIGLYGHARQVVAYNNWNPTARK